MALMPVIWTKAKAYDEDAGFTETPLEELGEAPSPRNP